MSIDKINQTIEKQEQRLKQLKAQRQQVIALERKKEKEQARRDDARRKILIGACMLKITENDAYARQRLMDQLDKYLTDDKDRALFGLG